MSIIKGTDGLLQVQANLITSAAYTFIVWLKPATTGAGIGTYFNYINAPGSYVRLWDPFPTGVRHSVEQGGFGASNVTTSTDIAGGAWSGVICAGTSARVASIHISGESVNAAGNFGVFDTPNNPTLNLMANSAGSANIPVGDKVGAVAIYASTLSEADRTHLLGGGALNSLPSETMPVEYWIDSIGVAKDGSDNLTSWTGQIAGTVLTPSGTVTVDDADLAPVATTTSTPTLRKTGQQTFDKPAGIGTITGVTLNGEAITLDSQDAETFTVTDSDGSITTSGEYDLVATGDTVETITVQVTVIGVTPANNPLQKDGAALGDLTDVEVRISAGATLAGTQLFYTGTATTDASGNLGSIDLSDTAADPDDAVVMMTRTADGDGMPSDETVGLI